MRLSHLLVGLLFAAIFIGLLSSCASSGVYHVVEPGQTLYRIAKTYGIEEERLAKVNGISNPSRLEVGQRIFIPGAEVPRTVPVLESKPASSPQTTPKRSQAASERSSTSVKKPKTASSQSEKTDQKPVPGTFVWPVRGKVIVSFGMNQESASKGVEIAIPHGSPVVASAAGKVIYSNEMRGYGNLIILEHADNFFTVYGFNAKNLVAVNTFVGQGERIALSGGPGRGKSPRLHFEIRKGKTAVDPIFYLP